MNPDPAPGGSVREAACSCGRLRATVTGDPIRVSACHCLACQRRTGSSFGVQARFRRDQVVTSGAFSTFERHADEDGEGRAFHFCPACGATVFYEYEGGDDIIVIPVGAFADPGFPPPTRVVYEDRGHGWVQIDTPGLMRES